MDEQLKRRLIGAIVLLSLAIIFLPMLLEHEPESARLRSMTPIPQEPERNFDPSLLQDRPPEPLPEPVTGLPSSEREIPQEPRKASAEAPPPASRPAPASEHPSAQPAAKPEPRQEPKPESKPKPKPKVKPTASGTPSGWIVQVASLTSRESAEKLVKKLRKAGLDTMAPRPVTVNGKRFYRVQVGPEISRENAESHLPLIKRIAGTKGRVMRYP